MSQLRARGLKPIAELSARRSHGDRLRYLAGCHCADCRRANSHYENERQKARRKGDWNGIVSSARARRHMRRLSRLGVGRRPVSIAADLAESVICQIRYNPKRKIRARTERKILAVTVEMASDHALVPARRSWKLIRMLLTEGYTKTYLAKQLGYSPPHIQFGKKNMIVKNAYRVAKLFERLMS